ALSPERRRAPAAMRRSASSIRPRRVGRSPRRQCCASPARPPMTTGNRKRMTTTTGRSRFARIDRAEGLLGSSLPYTIGIDARKIDDFGIGAYVRNLVLALARVDQENNYVLF